MKLSLAFILFIYAFSMSLLIGCQPGGESVLKIRERVLVVTSGDGNHRGVTIYDLEGNLISHVTDFRDEVSTPRGIAPFDDESFIVSTDGADAIYRVFYNGEKETFHGSNQFSGAIYGLERGPLGYYYAVESNRIEVFDGNGVRLGGSLINTTTGGCTLSNPRGSAVTSAGALIVANIGGADNILTYDITADPATCSSSVAFGNNPYDILVHSNGSIYVTTQGDDAVYQANLDGSGRVSIYDPGTALLNNPTAMVELDNGDILVASSATDTIERITPAGVRVGSVPFIRDAFSLNITDMRIMESYR